MLVTVGVALHDRYTHAMTTVTLTGTLSCATDAEIATVSELLPAHIAITRAEPGCISFEVTQSANPHIWHVAEEFSSEAAFQAHQARVSASEWGMRTAGIARDYVVSGLADTP